MRPITPLMLALLLAPAATRAAADPTTTTRPENRVVRLTLAEAVARAREANPAALAAEARIDAASALRDRAAAFGLPTLYVAGGYDATNFGGAAFGHILNQRAFSPSINFNDVGVQDNLGVALGARHMLYDGGRSRAAKRAAEAGERAERRSAESLSQDLAARAAELWHANAAAGPLVEAARAQTEAFESAVALAKTRVEAGVLLRAEQLLLEVRLARAREQLVNAEAARSLAARALLTLLDLEGDTVATLGDPAAGAPADPGPFDIAAHPVVAAMRERAAAAGGAEEAAAADRAPRVMMQGEYGYNRGLRSGEGAAGFAAGVRVEYDIFDGDLAAARVREARARRREAEAMLRAAELEVTRAVDEARTGVARAHAALRVTAHAEAAAIEAARVTRERFAAGAATALQVADAEAALLETRAGRIRAGASEHAASARLLAALGQSPFPEPAATTARTRP